MPITTETQSKANEKNKHASTTNPRDEKKKTGVWNYGGVCGGWSPPRGQKKAISDVLIILPKREVIL